MNLENNALTDFRGIKIKGRVPMPYPARRKLEERQETTKEHFAFRVSKYISANAKEAFVVVVVMYNTSKYIEALYLLSSFLYDT